MTPPRAASLPPDVRAEYPFDGRLFEQPGGAKMHYLDVGDGPAVLLLHGNPTWSFHFRRLIRTLVDAGFRCVAPDHVGCGLSDKPADYPYTLRRRIDDVERLVDRLGIAAFHLVVHDWGGAIGCGLATRRPEALRKLVLLNTAAFRSKRIPARIAALKIPLLGEAAVRGFNGFARPAVRMAVRRPMPPAVRRGYLWPYDNWAHRVAVWRFVRDIPLHRAHPSHDTLVAIENELGKLSEKPVCIQWGKRDFCFNTHFLRRWREYFPDAECDLHEDAGHYVLEDASETVCARTRKFL